MEKMMRRDVKKTACYNCEHCRHPKLPSWADEVVPPLVEEYLCVYKSEKGRKLNDFYIKFPFPTWCPLEKNKEAMRSLKELEKFNRRLENANNYAKRLVYELDGICKETSWHPTIDGKKYELIFHLVEEE